MNVEHMLKQVDREYKKVEGEIESLVTRRQSLKLISENLKGYTNGTTTTLPTVATEPIPNKRDIIPKRKGHRLSAAAKRRISLAQKARWAAQKGNGKEVSKIACPVCARTFNPKGIYPHLRSMHKSYKGAVKPKK
jgi:hypothetical protein